MTLKNRLCIYLTIRTRDVCSRNNTLEHRIQYTDTWLFNEIPAYTKYNNNMYSRRFLCIRSWDGSCQQNCSRRYCLTKRFPKCVVSESPRVVGKYWEISSIFYIVLNTSIYTVVAAQMWGNNRWENAMRAVLNFENLLILTVLNWKACVGTLKSNKFKALGFLESKLFSKGAIVVKVWEPLNILVLIFSLNAIGSPTALVRYSRPKCS